MEIVYAINNNYSQHIAASIASVISNNTGNKINFHIINTGISNKNKNKLKKLESKDVKLNFYEVSNEELNSYSVNIQHITKETYLRFLIQDILQNINKVLYLDADTIVNKRLDDIWSTDLTNYSIAGTNDNWIESVGYKKEIEFKKEELYINAGVLLLNLHRMRQENASMLFKKTYEKYKNIIRYQDQDIINIAYKGKIKELPIEFNYTFYDVISNNLNSFDKAVIFHFTGDKKPWNFFYKTGNPAEYLYYKYLFKTAWGYRLLKKYICKPKTIFINKISTYDKVRLNILGLNFEYKKFIKSKENKKIKVALLVDEFFGAAGTAYGGYGFLARNYIAKYLPNERIQLDVLLGFSKKHECTRVDDVNVYRLSKNIKEAKNWLNKQNYDLFLSVELTSSSHEILRLDEQKTRLLLWVQDPRPWYEWREIFTVKLFPETCYWDTPVYEYVNFLNWKRKVTFITQGKFLINKARDLYRLTDDEVINYLPNPIDIDYSFDINKQKKDKIIFLGRIESVKRGWLFCEIAKRCPDYDFYLLGQTYREKGKNSDIIDKYKNIPNLHFVGHVEGEQKEQFLKDAKILVNTSIHEALPISFIEALSYGVLLVSNRNPEQLTSKFGVWVGDVLGDGFDKVNLYVDAIEYIMHNDVFSEQKSREAIKYIKEIHDRKLIISKLQSLVENEASK